MRTINLTKVSSLLVAIANCKKSNNKEWEEKHSESLAEILSNLPNGSGLDAGVHFDSKSSKTDKLVFTFSFHHMNDGYYDGWTEHKLIITPTFGSFDIRITGRDKNSIKEYLYDLFHSVFAI